jgi:uncharacterized protein
LQEVTELREFLATAPGAMSFPEAHGFLTAIASVPTTMMPRVWQSEVLGKSPFVSMPQAQRVLGLVMRLHNQVITGLNENKPFAPPNSDDDGAISSWCTGYLKAARMDDVWIDDERGAVFMFPMAVLSGDADLAGEEDADGNVIADPAPQLRRCRELLAATVREANQYWTAWRRKSIVTPIAPRSQKVGRNDPCPCGSGQKYKKCCELEEG